VIFGFVDFAARNGLAAAQEASVPAEVSPEARAQKKHRARFTGVRGETYAYWYLRRRGYVFLARNYTLPGIKGEIDLVGYDGSVLAFIEVKTMLNLDFPRMRSLRRSAAFFPAWPGDFLTTGTFVPRPGVSTCWQLKAALDNARWCVCIPMRFRPRPN